MGLLLCGWFLLYLAAGSVAGVFVSGNQSSVSGCMPYVGMWGIIESSCDTGLGNAFWFVIVGLPRLFVLTTMLAVARISVVATGEFRHILEAGYWLALSSPFFILLYLGWRYWRPRRAWIGWIAVITVVAAPIAWYGLLLLKLPPRT